MLDKPFYLFAGGIFESLYAAVLDGVILDQNGIELVLPDELAKAIAKEVLAVSAVAADGLWGPLAAVAIFIRCERTRKGPNLLHRAEADAVRLTQSPIDRTSLGYPHLSTADQVGGVGGIGISIADEAFTGCRLVNNGLKCPTSRGNVTEVSHWPDLDSTAMATMRESQQARMRHVPLTLQQY